jgi:hypothetical protein
MRCSIYLFRCYSHPQYSGLSESAPATNKGDITGVSSTKWRMEVSGDSLYHTAARQALKSCVFPPLADTILDQRLQNAYKMPLRGDALRTRGATKTPGARTAGRRASVRRTQRCAAMVDAFLNKMYRSNADFVFTVTRDFVRACQTPLLVLLDDVSAHPYAVAMEAVCLAPKAAVSIYPWKEPKALIPQAVRQVRDFLRAHHPVAAAH